MSDFKKPATEKDYSDNFKQLHPLMNATQAYFESSRCLFCYDAPCIKACPTGIDIPLFIKQINTGNLSGSATTIYQSNWFGNICGKVCPTSVLCEGACVYNHQDVKPIEIGRLQSYATTEAIANRKKLFKVKERNGKKVAVIGAGPAGISAACELCLLGYSVKIFEAKEHPSGLAMYGVAPYKIENEDILEEIAYLQDQFGFEIIYDHAIQNKETFITLEKDFDAIFLGLGLGTTRELQLNGEELPGCVGAVEFIENLKIQKYRTAVGERVVVLGGGNTAMDAASEACRLGAAQVIIAYRRAADQKGAYQFEYELAREVGAKGIWNVSPLAVVGSDKVEGVKFIKTRTKDQYLEEIPGSEFTIPCDMVIKATGQHKQKQVLSMIDHLQMDPNGRIRTVNEYFQTHNPRYFTGGDAFNGGKEVVNAVAEAKIAARGIHQYLEEINNG